MLPQSELVWLKRRQFFSDFYSSGCLTCSLNETLCDRTGCLLHPDLEDAIEFSERVAAKLAKHIHDKPLVCETNWDCPYWPQGKCAWCYLKAARIEVEEEMDNEP